MTSDSRNDRFYEDLPSFDRFGDFVDFASYSALPDGWVVVITDVVGSTRAIEGGRYKQVNMVGAASITAVLNIADGLDLPFVFGGDGATLAVPPSLRDAACDALLRLQSASQAMFGLDLRVGAVQVAELRAKGADLRVRKYRLSPGNHLAMFGGGGTELADALVKDASPDNPYLIAPRDDAGEPNLEGLSCRWEPLVPEGGRMLTLLVRGTGSDSADEGALLKQVVDAIADILGHEMRASAPANPFSMRFRWPPRGLGLEVRATAGKAGYVATYARALFTSLVQLWCERFDKKAGDYDAPAYREELRSNTDFRKYDGLLRAVLDVTETQADAIETYLDREYRADRLVYGTHVADRALMTCLVFSLAKSEHVHFVDGADGGFALAARGFKQRVRERAEG